MALRWLSSKARLYRNTGTTASPTWTRWATRQRVGVNRGSEFADVSAEDSEGFKDQQPTQKTFDVEVEAFVSPAPETDASYLAVVASYESGEPMEIAIAYGDITVAGTKYLRCPMHPTITEDLNEKDPNKYKVAFTKSPGEKPVFQTVPA